jgi:glycosyltransferase involved in cell wall biosynthesis
VTTVHVVVPDGIDDPARPSGGNTYDQRICDGLTALGWDVRELAVPGPWPRPDAAALSALARLVASVPDDGLVVIDGLIASAAPAVLVPASGRVRLVVLVHMPLAGAVPAEDTESAVLAAARAVVTTSSWTREWLLDRHPLHPERVHVAHPGVDQADPAPGTPAGGRLLCVAAVVPAKGQQDLVAALAGIADLPWRCALVGSLDRAPEFVGQLRRQVVASGVADRISLSGPRVGDALRREYEAADLLVLPSHSETYGMVITEALAAGLPVIATAVGGVPEALGRTRSGPPGLLVAPGDGHALQDALARWLRDGGLRRRLRRAAQARRATLEGWDATSSRIASVLSAVDGEPAGLRLRVPR